MKNVLEGISQTFQAHAHRTREQIHAASQAVKTKAKHDSSEEDLAQVPAYTVDLAFRFIGASGLPPMDVGGNSDPYFVASLDDTISFTSSVKPRTLTPVWNAEWFVKNVPVTAQLEVKLYDKDNGAVRDDFIGKFKVGLEEGAREVRIESSAGAQMGTMWLETHFSETREPGDMPQYTFDGPVSYSRYFSPTVGLFVGSKDQRPDPDADMDHSKEIKAMISKGTDSKQDPPQPLENKPSALERAQQHGYSTWKVHLKGVPQFFGDEHQHWLESYPAAQKIFKGPKVLRASIRSAHRVLYARTTMNEYGLIEKADDFWRELSPLESRSSDPSGHSSNPKRDLDRPAGEQPEPNSWRVKPVLYTYIIGDDDMLRFSETGAAFFVDFASKHALHACVAETVRYSGEFHARPLVDGGWAGYARQGAEEQHCEWELLIDNSSGTYGPDKTLLPALCKTLEYNFPGIRVRAFHFKDEELEQSKKAMEAYAKGTSSEGTKLEGSDDKGPAESSHEPSTDEMKWQGDHATNPDRDRPPTPPATSSRSEDAGEPKHPDSRPAHEQKLEGKAPPVPTKD